MRNVSDYFVFNDVPYSEFNGEIKAKLDGFVNALDKAALTNEILNLDPSKRFMINSRVSGNTFITGDFPPDLIRKMSDIWVKDFL